MRSIRQQLLFSLLLGISLLLGAVGCGLYLSTRATLRDQFDSALAGQALAMAGAIKQEGDKLEIEFRDNSTPAIGGTNLTEFYQVFLVGGGSLRKSRSLGKAELPRQWGAMETPEFFAVSLPSGAIGRAIGLRFVPRFERRGNAYVEVPEIGLVVAHDRSKLDRAIRSLGGSVGLGGILTLAAMVLLVERVLRRCLAPLNRLVAEVEQVDATSLKKRFPASGLPAELDPICARLNDLLARLEHSFSEVNEYAAKVAHELRTPLTILRLKIDQAGGTMPPELAEELQAEVHHLAHVIDQSLLIARAEHGRLAAELSTFDLTAMLEEAAEDFSLLAAEENRRVQFDRKQPCVVSADAKFVRQILHNLLSNALKHGVGEIRLRVRPHGGRCDLLILNPVRREPNPSEMSLGLGLRVVESLLRLQPEMRSRRRRGRRYYAVRFSLPAGGDVAAGPELPRLHAPA